MDKDPDFPTQPRPRLIVPLAAMDLRDYFAAAFIGAIPGGQLPDEVSSPEGERILAAAAYKFADAMLKEREKT